MSAGKYDEALVYCKEALETSRAILGNTHPDTLVSINNIGAVLKAQGTEEKDKCFIFSASESIYYIVYGLFLLQ